MSHIVKCKTELKDLQTVIDVAKDLGAEIIGNGKHRVYSTDVEGFAVKLPGWNFPIVINQESGEISYDNYNGHWGDIKKLETFKERYVQKVVEKKADELGWLHEREGNVLKIYYPKGGTISVSPDGKIETEGFIGGTCETASSAIEQALGARVEQTLKHEHQVNEGIVQIKGS